MMGSEELMQASGQVPVSRAEGSRLQLDKRRQIQPVRQRQSQGRIMYECAPALAKRTMKIAKGVKEEFQHCQK